jgi:hypothetical protein
MLGWTMILGIGIIGCGHEQKSPVPLFPVHGTVILGDRRMKFSPN